MAEGTGISFRTVMGLDKMKVIELKYVGKRLGTGKGEREKDSRWVLLEVTGPW